MALKEILTNVKTWAEDQNGITALYLYGSQAEGHANALSDIDIAVLADRGFEREALWELEDKWAGKWLGQLDLRVMNLASIAFRFEVITRGERIWESDLDQVAEVESITRRRYWDLKPLLDRDWAAFKEQIAESRSESERIEYQKTLAKIRAVHRRVREASSAR